MATAHPGQDGPLAPVLRELSRIAGDVESTRAAEDRKTIEALRKEVAELRATVAQLRASRHPVPGSPRPSVPRPRPVEGDTPQSRSHTGS
jgi:hypothetical protein